MWWCLNQSLHCLICTFCTLHIGNPRLVMMWWWSPVSTNLAIVSFAHWASAPTLLPAWKTHLARQGVPTNCPLSRPPSIWVTPTPRCITTLCTSTQNGHYTATLKVGWVDVKVFWVYFSSQLLATCMPPWNKI